MLQPTQNVDSPFIHVPEKLEEVHSQQSKRCESDLVVRIMIPQHLAESATCNGAKDGTAHITS
jgi:hypothetical protein